MQPMNKIRFFNIRAVLIKNSLSVKKIVEYQMKSIKETIKKVMVLIILEIFLINQVSFGQAAVKPDNNSPVVNTPLNVDELKSKANNAKENLVIKPNEAQEVKQQTKEISREEEWKNKGFDIVEADKVEVEKDENIVIKYKNVTLEIEKGAVKNKTVIGIEELKEINNLNPGMNNVTDKVIGYRFLPNGMKFEKNIKITIPFDKNKIASEEEYPTLYTYFYNEEEKRWDKLERINVDRGKGELISLSDHFTDMINSTLKMPESPKPLSFNPNSIKDIKAANPMAGIPEINGLEGTPFGSANFSLALNIPQGRNGMTPKVSIDYNSDNTNGWLGVGFDINIPCVSIDTRFGLPDYDDLSNNIYSLNGEELVILRDSNGIPIQPPTYKTRVEGGFQKIIRTSNSFEVTDKDGKKSIYGALFGPAANNIFKYYLSQVIDPDGNTINYTYTNSDNYLYLSSINYTGYINGDSGEYTIVFNNDASRDDKIINCRGKFESKLNNRLSEIDIFYKDQGTNKIVKKYILTYIKNDFKKSCISNITETDGNQAINNGQGNIFYSYNFDYYGKSDVSNNGNMFGDTEEWDCGTGFGFGLTSSHNVGGGGGMYIGAGVSLDLFKTITSSFGGGMNLGFNLDTGFDSVTFTDLDGDRLPDIIGKTGTGNIQTLLNRGNQNLGFEYKNYNNVNFGKLFNNTLSPSFSIGGGFDFSTNIADAVMVSTGFSVGGSFGWSYALNKIIDLDGDGIIDFIPGVGTDTYWKGKWEKDTGFTGFDYNKGWELENPSITTVSQTLSSGSDNASMTGTNTQTNGNETISTNDMNNAYHKLDPVFKWKAYHYGNVEISGNAVKTNDQMYKDNTDDLNKQDGVTISVYRKNEQKFTQDLKNSGDSANIDLTAEIQKDDNLYFRVSSKTNIYNDTINWNPEIRI